MRPALQTPRLCLCPAAYGDLEPLHALWTDPEVRRYLFDDVVISQERASDLLTDILRLSERERGLGLWVIEPREGGAPVGCAGLLPADHTAAFSPRRAGGVEPLVALSPDFWGRGLATEALRALFAHAFGALGLPRLVAAVDVPNTASLRLVERLGMAPTGEVSGPRHRLRTFVLHPAAAAPPPVRVALPGGCGYDVRFDALRALPPHLADAGLEPGPCFVVTDQNVGPLYLDGLRGALERAGWAVHALTLAAGEATKSPERLAEIYDWALSLGVERGDPMLALGGGVIGDLAGFAAATLLRGVPLVQIPTSLVAQVDSAVGGKTGINHPKGKNLIGAFHQPRLVLADPSALAALPEREFCSGLAEVVKAALIADAVFFEWLEANWMALLGRDPGALGPAIRRAVAIKATVVGEDEREEGRRALLNFGHTFGHAIERAAGYGRFLHGEAVSLGMRAALHLSASLAAGRALLPDGGLPAPLDRADRLVEKIPVPASLDGISGHALDTAMRTDKKRAGGRARFVVLERIGAARVEGDVPPEMVAAAWAYARRVSRAGA